MGKGICLSKSDRKAATFLSDIPPFPTLYKSFPFLCIPYDLNQGAPRYSYPFEHHSFSSSLKTYPSSWYIKMYSNSMYRL